MLDFYSETKLDDHKPAISKDELSDQQVINEIFRLKEKLKDKVVVLGHHYQQDDVIQFSDYKGDSLKLAKDAAKLDAPYVIFCGVHFMAETADMLTSVDQKVILPDMNAGCSMADMANNDQIEKAWENIQAATDEKVIPITYINCTAALKSFVGKNDGSICTSSNAHKIIKWALDKGEKLLFFPDQHLGRNTCHDLGIELDDMIIYNPNMLYGGVTKEQIQKAKVILWYGYCSVHQGFNAGQVKQIKKDSPDTTVIVHPECSFDVVQASDMNGSTAYIIDTIKNAPRGSKWAVGTEINLVNRLQDEFKDKEIKSLSPYQCLCTTMYRVRPRWLLETFRSIEKDQPINVIKVSDEVKENALKALDRMLQIS
ncbi:MAG: quinolinate synthase NadA [Bacteriovoracaceae bacterium]|jgi:quinolinate synthase|nr:quinolinate synthase NadA [Bacteriovoracaceae bacterium]